MDPGEVFLRQVVRREAIDLIAQTGIVARVGRAWRENRQDHGLRKRAANGDAQIAPGRRPDRRDWRWLTALPGGELYAWVVDNRADAGHDGVGRVTGQQPDVHGHRRRFRQDIALDAAALQ